MKKLLVLLLVLGLASVSLAAPADVYVGFNSTEDTPAYALGHVEGQGDSINGWAGPWVDDSDGRPQGKFEVVEGGCTAHGPCAGDPDQHLQMYGADSSGWKVYRPLSGFDGDFIIEICQKWNYDGGTAAAGQLELENASGRALSFKWETSGIFRLNDENMISYRTTPAPYKNPQGAWVKTRVAVDISTATFDLYWELIDGTMGYVGTHVGFKDSGFDSGTLDMFNLNAPKTGVAGMGMELDNVRITPEPMTIALLGLGGLLLRRRKA